MTLTPECLFFQAVDDMYAERIGHGYRIMGDKSAYARCLKEKIHFETCPTSSILTGSVSISDAMMRKHPILVSINSELEPVLF